MFHLMQGLLKSLMLPHSDKDGIKLHPESLEGFENITSLQRLNLVAP